MPFTQPALIMAHWNNTQRFISCAALKIFPSCSSAVYNNILVPLFAESDLSKKEVLGLPGGNKFLFYNKSKKSMERTTYFLSAKYSLLLTV